MLLRSIWPVFMVVATPGAVSPSTASSFTIDNPIPPRLQWNENYGYCGEVSFISAGLYYGQYISQYDARAIASQNTPQNRSGSQLLIGVNDTYAAAQMHLSAVEWNTATETGTSAFLAWVKGNVQAGYPVAIGVYTNEFLFYGTLRPGAGDPDYDHIVPVTGIASNHPLSEPASYYSDDTITFSDNGLWTGTSDGQPPYLFSYPFGSFQASRRQANAKTGPVYSISNDNRNYGIAITGVIDPGHETMPVRLSTNVNYERPEIQEGSNTRPASMPLVLTITVSDLKPGVAYNLYRYDDIAAVPNSAFNANASKAAQVWKINIASGSSYVTAQTIDSNEIAVYRAVPASGP